MIIVIGPNTLARVNRLILGCEAWSRDAEIPLNWLLDEVTGEDAAEVEYLLEAPAKYPWCYRKISEKTLVDW